jgi:nucleoside-diphosphate-sugar epimerase
MHLVIFGLGYTAARIARAFLDRGGVVTATRREASAEVLDLSDAAGVMAALASATHILSSVPPVDGRDPVLDRYAVEIARAPAQWSGYLSSTGVYGDVAGAWIDESARTGIGRRAARAIADQAWLELRGDMRVFRLPGIYGPGRSALDRARASALRRIDLPDQVFSRVHVADIVSGVLASFAHGPAGAYNLADDLPASQNDIVAEACALTGVTLPPLLPLANAGLSPQARAFYSENRRVANGKAKRLLRWRPMFADYRAGLRALNAMPSPTSTSTPPEAAIQLQR